MNDPTNISILKNSSFITTYIEIRFQNLKIRNYLILRWKKKIFNFIKTSRREGERPGTTFFIQFHWSSIFSFSCDTNEEADSNKNYDDKNYSENFNK